MASVGASLSAAVVASPRPGTSPGERLAASRPMPVTAARPTVRRPSAEDEAALLLGGGAGSPYEAAADCFGSASLGSARMGSLSSSLSRAARPRSSGTSPAAASVVGFAGAASPQGLKPPVPGSAARASKGPGLLRRELSRETVLATPAAELAAAPEAAARKATAAERGARPDERTATVRGRLAKALADDRLTRACRRGRARRRWRPPTRRATTRCWRRRRRVRPAKRACGPVASGSWLFGRDARPAARRVAFRRAARVATQTEATQRCSHASRPARLCRARRGTLAEGARGRQVSGSRHAARGPRTTSRTAPRG